MENLQLENDFWLFTLSRYAKPGVAETCLVLQNQHGANINLLLYCLWLAKKGRSLEWQRIQENGDIDSWHQQQVLPVRQLRLLMKETAHASEAQRHYYESLKKEELGAEQVEQAMLFQVALEMPLVAGVQPVREEGNCPEASRLALGNLEKYSREALPASGELKPLLDKLVQLVV